MSMVMILLNVCVVLLLSVVRLKNHSIFSGI